MTRIFIELVREVVQPLVVTKQQLNRCAVRK